FRIGLSRTIENKSAKERKGPFLSRRAARVAHDTLVITGHTQKGASAGDTVFQPRIQVDLLALDHHEEKVIIIDITTINTTAEMSNFERKQAKQQEYTGVPSLTRTRLNLESIGGVQQNKIDGDTRICGLLRNQLKFNPLKCNTHMPTALEHFYSRSAHCLLRFTTSYLTNHLPDIQLMHTSCVQQQVRVQGRLDLHILPKDRVGIKHRATIDQPQLKPHPHMRTLLITEGATTTEKEDTGNRTTINAHSIATDT
ncbi:MAG: hypothetical protein EZS28_004648, partial [Streblomastix strix]